MVHPFYKLSISQCFLKQAMKFVRYLVFCQQSDVTASLESRGNFKNFGTTLHRENAIPRSEYLSHTLLLM